VLGEPGKLRVGSCTRKDLGVLFSDGASALTFKRSRDYRGTTPRVASGDNPIHKLHELVWKPDSDLLAHPIMVSNRYHSIRDPSLVLAPTESKAS
jgi:hypothetical protein